MVITISENPQFLPAKVTVEGDAEKIHETVRLFKAALLGVGYAQETVDLISVEGAPPDEVDGFVANLELSDSGLALKP